MEKEIRVYGIYEDDIDMGMVVSKSPINQALENKFLNRFGTSELKTRLFSVLSHLPDVQMRLVVSCSPDTNKVAEIALKCVFENSTIPKDKIEELNNVVESYFKSIGYEKLTADNYEDMVSLLERIDKDIHIIKNNFKY